MKRLVAIGVMAALALTACTGGDGDTDSGGTVVTGGGSENGDEGSGDVDPCELLTTAEVEAAVGNPVGDGAADIGLATCDWVSEPVAGSASVAFLAFDAPRVCADALAADSANQRIEGFDDAAFWTFVPTAGGVGTISVCTAAGQLIVTVTAGREAEADEAAVRTATEDLTGQALTRL